jgi:hypothetical protein
MGTGIGICKGCGRGGRERTRLLIIGGTFNSEN